MKTDGTPFQVSTNPAANEKSTPRLPHERDESEDSQAKDKGAVAPRGSMKQAHDDIKEGQVDTDLHNQRGVEAVNNPVPVEPSASRKT